MSAPQRSTANPAQQALVARLAARDELDGAIVQVGLPAEVPSELDRVYVTSIEDLQRSRAGALAAAPRIFHETYTLVLLIECHRFAADSRDAVNDRMWQIIAELEQELADDTELADDVDDAYVESIPSAFTHPEQDGWTGKAIVNVHIDALCQLA